MIPALMILLVAVMSSMPQILPAQQVDRSSADTGDLITTDAEVIVIRNVRLVDGTGAPAMGAQTIVIRNGRLEHIGDSINIPPEAAVIDGSEFTALPGLVMMHEHMNYVVGVQTAELYLTQPTSPSLYMAAGVTTLRTVGSGATYADLITKSLVDEGHWIGPDMDVSILLEGPNPSFPDLAPLALRTPADVSREIGYWAHRGATSVKAFWALEEQQLQVAIKEAHKRGMKVAGHLCAVTAAKAADLGIDSLEHGLMSMSDFVVNKQPDICPSVALSDSWMNLDIQAPDVQRMIAKLVDGKVAVTSTLAAYASNACPSDRPVKAAFEALTPRARTVLQASLDACRQESEPTERTLKWRAILRNEMAFERAFVAAGGMLLAGSDAEERELVPGYADHWQLEMMVDAGFTPLQTIKFATSNGASFLNRLAEIGTLEEGKRADLILVRGRPDENISDIRNVIVVFKNGIGYDAVKLIESAQGTIG